LADNEKSLAQEYKDLNVKINKLKSELKVLAREDKKVNVDNSVEIASKQKELTDLEEQRKKNRDLSKEKVSGFVSAKESKKTQSELKKIDEEIAFIERTGSLKPIVAQERKTPGLSPLGESGRAEPGLGQDFGVVAATDEYLNTLKTRRNKILNKPDAEEEVKADAGFEQPLTTTGGGGLRSAATPAVPGTIIVGLDVSADIDPARQAERKVLPGSQDGIFTINDPAFVGGEYLFLGTAGTAETFSKPVGYEQFEYGLYKMAPEEVISYKKALGYSNPTSVVDKKFKDDMLQAARTVSELNYGNAVAGKRVQASLEGYLSTPQKYGFAATGVKAGPSAEEVKVKADAIRIYATDLGVGLDDAAVNKLAREWAAGRFDTTTIKPQIARSGKIDFAKGAAAEQLNTLKELAGSYGMQYDQGWYNTAATNVLTGKDDIETYKQYVRDQAKSKFPTLVAQLDQGFTVRQLASPYIQTMSNILEIDPNTIGLNDVYVNQALTGLDAEGKPSTKPLWQFEQDLRKDPRWNFTKNAQDSLMNTTRKVLQDFGLVS
jgi:hypothetical protein